MPVTRLRSGVGKRRDYAAMAGKKSRKPRLGKPTATAVRKIVKSELSRNAEDKMISTFETMDHNCAISTGDVYPLIPLINKGTDSHQRIGDVIRPKRLVVRCRVRLSGQYWGGTYGGMVPLQVRVLILKQKTIKNNGSLPALFDFAHLLRANIGSSAELPFTGQNQDALSPINKDLFEVVMDKRVWLRPTNVGATANNTYPLEANCVEFVKAIKCPKSLTYDDGNNTSPNNFAPFLVAGFTSADGSPPAIINTPVTVELLSTLYYEDS